MNILEQAERRRRLIDIARTLGDLGDDAMLYPESRTWEDWQNHVSIEVRHAWESLPTVARACVVIQATSMTAWQEPVAPKDASQT